jgi:hypothetical protein
MSRVLRSAIPRQQKLIKWQESEANSANSLLELDFCSAKNEVKTSIELPA